MSDRAELFAAAPFDARELGRRFVTRRRRIGLALILGGLALFVGGFVGFGVSGGRADALQKNGVHTTATVTDTALYTPFSNRLTEHIDVAFTTPSGPVQGVRIPIGEDDRFDVGQKVEISYDPANPHRAVFAHGDVDLGSIGFVYLLAIVAGVGVLIHGVRTRRLARGADRALAGPPRTMLVESRLVPQGRLRRTALLLTDEGGGEPSPLWATAGSYWPHSRQGEATVFGTRERGSVVVVVDPQIGNATAGRIWKNRRI